MLDATSAGAVSAPSAPVVSPVSTSPTVVTTTIASPCAPELSAASPVGLGIACGSVTTMHYGEGQVQRLTEFTASVAGVPQLFRMTRTSDGATAQQVVDLLRVANAVVGIDPNTGAPARRNAVWMSRAAGTPTSAFTNILGDDPGLRTMESILGDDIINDGADNVFANAGGAATNLNNIERVSFLSPQLVTITEPTRSGILIMDRGGNDPFRIAVVRSLGPDGSPATFGSTVNVATGQWAQLFPPLPSTVLRRDPLDAAYRPSSPVGAQPVSGVFVSYAELGVAPGTAVAGVALVARDEVTFVTAHSWKTTTNDTTDGGLDLLGGLLVDSVPDGTVTGRLYVDTDKDGTDSVGDPGLGNVVVNLTGPTGIIFRTTRTAPDGTYSFAGLAPFSYTVRPDPTTVSDVLAQPTSETDPESSPTALDGLSTFSVTSASPAVHAGFSFGYTAIEQISGATRDTQGTPIPSVVLTLLDATGTTVLATTVTDTNGHYSFAARPVGRYRIVQTQPVNYLSSSPNQLDVETVFATASAGNDFIELAPSGAISGAVRTISGDPIPGVSISLAGSSVQLTAVSDSRGLWDFGGLLPGSYRVTELQPAGYPSGSESPGTNATTSAPNTIDVGLVAAGSSVGNLFVEGAPVGLVSGLVLTHSGTGTTGVTIELLTQGLVLRSTVTDADGAWAFPGLASGSYVVRQAGVDPHGGEPPTPGTNAILGADGLVHVTLTISASELSSSVGNVLFGSVVSPGLASTGYGAGAAGGIIGGALLVAGCAALLVAGCAALVGPFFRRRRLGLP